MTLKYNHSLCGTVHVPAVKAPIDRVLPRERCEYSHLHSGEPTAVSRDEYLPLLTRVLTLAQSRATPRQQLLLDPLYRVHMLTDHHLDATEVKRDSI